MKRIILAASAALALAAPAMAGSATLADRCMARVTKGAVTVYRDVDVLASGRDRIAYFRCIRTGARDDGGLPALAVAFPRIDTGFGGGGTGFSGVSLNL
jgi:hypothetical protein